jgi:hypothetical protein
MNAGIGNIGCSEEEREHFAALTNPIASALYNQELASHPMPADADERIAKAENLFMSIEAKNRGERNGIPMYAKSYLSA